MADKKTIEKSNSFSFKMPAFFVLFVLLLFSVSLTSFAAEKDMNITVGRKETITLKSLGAADCIVGTDSELFRLSDDRITAVSRGTGDIELFKDGGFFKTVHITVMKAPTSVRLNKTELTLCVGEEFNFNAYTNKGSASRQRVYKSSSNILTYKGSGIFKAEKKGKAVVSITTYNGKTASCNVTVVAAPKKISFKKAKTTLGKGESFDFKALLKKNAALTKPTFSSNSKRLSQVKDGIFKADKKGNAVVTATLYNGKTASCSVKILAAPKRITVQKNSYSLSIGETRKIKVVLPENSACSTFYYKSSDPSVVSIDQNGAFQARKIGYATLTVETYNQKVQKISVEVSRMQVPFVNQFPYYPTGCEAASCTSLLRYCGYDVSLGEMIDAIPRSDIVYKNGRRYGPDINKSFVGNPSGTYTSGNPGYGAFSPVVTKSIQKVINRHDGTNKAVKLTGCSFKELLNEISNGHPAVVWATYEMLVPSSVNSWYIPQPDGSAKYFEYPRGTHVMVLTGYSDSYVTITDPICGYVSYNISTFENRWHLLGNQAIIIK